jgi:integrase
MSNNLLVNEIAKDLGISERTVRNYCNTGYLPSLQLSSKGRLRYEVESHIYYEWKQKHFKGLKKGQASKYTSLAKEMSLADLREAIPIWLEWNEAGKISGKPVSKRTTEINQYYFELYLKGLDKYPEKPIISINNLRTVLGTYRPENFATKRNIYEAVMSITRYLIEIKEFTNEDREGLKKLKPRRFLPAKKTCLTESQLNQLIASIDSLKNTDKEKIVLKALIIFLANTGLRASECCNLKDEDVDLENGTIKVVLGKGNKNRIVGINSDTKKALIDYIKVRKQSNYPNFFINKCGSPMTPDRLNHRLAYLTKRIGLKGISPHSLRRTFVTINAGKGKPLNHLRIACGHSSLSTTQGYCMTSQDEVVDAMKGW